MGDMDIRPPEGSRKNKRIVGRGNSGRRGARAGKGNKGQNSRAGGGVRPGFEGGQMPLYRRIPRKGFSNSPFKREYEIVNVSTLEKRYANGETVSLETLKEKRIIKKRSTAVKILGEGELAKKLTVEITTVSAQATAKIEKAGGTVTRPASGAESPAEVTKPAAVKAGAESAAEPIEKENEGSVDGE